MEEQERERAAFPLYIISVGLDSEMTEKREEALEKN